MVLITEAINAQCCQMWRFYAKFAIFNAYRGEKIIFRVVAGF